MTELEMLIEKIVDDFTLASWTIYTDSYQSALRSVLRLNLIQLGKQGGPLFLVKSDE